jgi:hypothetical protein
LKTCCCANKKIFVVLVVFFVFTSISRAAPSSDPETILQGLRKSYEWTDHIIMHILNMGYSTITPQSTLVEKFYFFNDRGTHQQTYGTTQMLDSISGKAYRDVDGPDPGRQFQTMFSPQTEGYFLHEHRAIGEVSEVLDIYEAGEERNHTHMMHPERVGPVLGHVFPFSKERLQDLLTPDIVTVREDGLSTVVVEATVPQGHVELWLSVEKGYAMEKCRLTKVAGKDLGYDGQVYYHSFALVDKPIQTEKTIQEINVIKHELIEGKYVPVQMDMNLISQWEGGETTRTTQSITLSEIKMNPDTELLRAFEFTVPEGTHTHFRTINREILTGFKWEDGKLVADVDADALDANIRTAIAQLTTGKGSNDGKSPGAVTLQKAGTAGRGAFLSKHGRLLTWIAGALFLLACGAVGIFAYKSRKEKTNLTVADSPIDEESSHASEGLEEHE